MKVTLDRSVNGPDGTVVDPVSGVVLHVGQTVDVPEDVAGRLASTRALGEQITLEAETPEVENDPPAPAPADAPPTAPEAQEVV